MSWYKIEIHCGPGHQGTHINHVWYVGNPEKVDEETKREWIDDEVRAHSWIEDAIGTVEPVDSIPEEERQEKIRMYRGQLAGAKAMLKVLGAE